MVRHSCGLLLLDPVSRALNQGAASHVSARVWLHRLERARPLV